MITTNKNKDPEEEEEEGKVLLVMVSFRTRSSSFKHMKRKSSVDLLVVSLRSRSK